MGHWEFFADQHVFLRVHKGRYDTFSFQMTGFFRKASPRAAWPCREIPWCFILGPRRMYARTNDIRSEFAWLFLVHNDVVFLAPAQKLMISFRMSLEILADQQKPHQQRLPLKDKALGLEETTMAKTPS